MNAFGWILLALWFLIGLISWIRLQQLEGFFWSDLLILFPMMFMGGFSAIIIFIHPEGEHR